MEKTSSVELIIPPANIIFQTSSIPLITPSNMSQQQGLIPTSSVPNLILSPPAPSSSSLSTSNSSFQMQLIHNNQQQIITSLNYLYKIITNGLIDLFEKHFSSNKSSESLPIKIFDLLLRFLEGYYLSNFLISTNLNQQQSNILSDDSSINSINIQELLNDKTLPMCTANQLQAQMNPKYFNYYATLRRDVFEFLLRIRSDSKGKVLLIDRHKRRIFKESKHLHLILR
jgi:hypothetical protein